MLMPRGRDIPSDHNFAVVLAVQVRPDLTWFAVEQSVCACVDEDEAALTVRWLGNLGHHYIVLVGLKLNGPVLGVSITRHGGPDYYDSLDVINGLGAQDLRDMCNEAIVDRLNYEADMRRGVHVN